MFRKPLSSLTKAGLSTLLGVWVASTLAAFSWVAAMSGVTHRDFIRDPLGFRSPLRMFSHFYSNYAAAWGGARLGEYFFNSLLVAGLSVSLSTVLGSLAAYALVRTGLRFSSAVLLLLSVSMAIPAFLLVTPLFLLLRDVHVGGLSLANSRFGLSVLYAALALPFTTVVLAGFYRTLPSELGEAARVDGASGFHVFARVYFPLSLPGLVPVAIFNFLAIWNEYSFALIFLTNANYRTLPVGLYGLELSQRFAVNWPVLFAGVIIVCVPTLALFVALQKRIARGVTAGAIKG